MWINENTLGIFILHADIRHECWKNGTVLPGVLTDEILAQNGYALVTQVKPAYNPITHKLEARVPVKTDTGWVQEFDALELDPAIVANNHNQATVERINILKSKIRLGDVQALRYLFENDTAKLDAWNQEVVGLKAEVQALEATLPPTQVQTP